MFVHWFFLAGILITSHNSPPITTALEPCRVAPYVNVPANLRVSTAVTSSTVTPASFPGAANFSAFDPALLTAAHQVSAWTTKLNWWSWNFPSSMQLQRSAVEVWIEISFHYLNTHSILRQLWRQLTTKTPASLIYAWRRKTTLKHLGSRILCNDRFFVEKLVLRKC